MEKEWRELQGLFAAAMVVAFAIMAWIDSRRR